MQKKYTVSWVFFMVVGGYVQADPLPAVVVVSPEKSALHQGIDFNSDTAALADKTIQEIKIIGIKNAEQEKNARIFLSLSKVKGEKITQPDYIRYLINSGREEISRSQQPFGYYHTKVSVAVEPEDNKNELRVLYQVQQNEPTLLGTVDVKITGEALKDKAFQKLLAENPLKSGEKLNHNQYETYKAKFAALATARGYFDARFTEHTIEVNPTTNRADIYLTFAGGARYVFSHVHFNKTPLNNNLLQRFVQFKPGEPYMSADVATLQQDLQGSGYFSQALVGGEPDKANKTVPVNAQLTMNKNKYYSAGIGYSTDSGVRGKFDFNRRWVNSRGHQFSAKLYLSQKNSNFDTLYRIPAANPTTDYYYLRLGGHIKGDAYDSKRGFIEGGYNFYWHKWEHRYGVVASWEKFTIGLDNNQGWMIYPHAQWTYTSTKNRLNPKDGYQFRFEALGASKSLLSEASLLQANTDIRYLKSLNDKNRLLGRLSLGTSWTDNFHRLPPSLRYFAGGDRSIRGYAYDSIGSRDSEGNNIGGRYLAVGSLEYEYYFRPDWAVAAFVDTGDAFVNHYKNFVGAGTGLHWQSPVGPIKIDVAHGFNKDYGDKMRLHISIGAELDL